MKRLYIIDLDGTVGLFHLFEALQDRMLLRPGLKEGLASMDRKVDEESAKVH